MKKIGIITIYDENNYGNRLQNYAVQEVLKSMNFDVQTIKNINLENKENYFKQVEELLPARRKKFLKFIEENMNNTDEIILHSEISKNFHEKYDYFVIGSDQIWNYNFKDRFSDVVFANFAPKEKRISFSASFGISEVPNEDYNIYDELKNIKAISVREKAGAEIVKKITGRNDAVVLIDPTMMISKEKWMSVMKRPEQLNNKKYILKYFLGKFSNEKQKEIELFAKANDCEIVDVLDKNSFYATGPSEFLYLIKNAYLVITDSFHSCVFSILFNTPFLIYEREQIKTNNMYSRIDTLLNTFKLNDRKFKGKIEKTQLEVDYSHIENILSKEQYKVTEFLNKALKIEM